MKSIAWKTWSKEELQAIETGATMQTELLANLNSEMARIQSLDGIQSASVVVINSPFADAIPVSMAFFL